MTVITREQRERLKSILVRYPALFRTVRAGYITFAVVQRELLTLIRFAPRLAASALRSTESRPTWQRELPVQRPPRIDASRYVANLDPQTIRNWCVTRNSPFAEGGDAIYLPPETWRSTPLGFFARGYPPHCGLKIAKQPNTSDGFYVTPKIGRALSQKLTFTHRLQTLIFNVLYLHDIAPRLYDLVEIEDAGARVCTAYVVEHIVSAQPRKGDSERTVRRLKELEASKLIKLVSAAGWGGIDFEPPDCNRNLLREAGTGRLVYVDVHNFILDQYERHLHTLAAEVAADSHFGGRSVLFGGLSGSFLYQEIPGLDRPAKRSPRARMQSWDSLLARAGLSLEGKAVFDVGCNLGLMGAEYLRRGARWLHGWDQPHVVNAAHRVLLSIGCTRFSLSGGKLDGGTDLVGSLPDHIKALAADDAVLSYLAIRGHVGWLPALSKLPWRYMLYEGHQDDRRLETYVSELNARIPVRLLATEQVSDGVSAARDVAVLERTAL